MAFPFTLHTSHFSLPPACAVGWRHGGTMKSKVLGIVRHALTFGGGFIVAKGWLTEAMVPEVVGAVITLVGAVWSAMAPEKQGGGDAGAN